MDKSAYVKERMRQLGDTKIYEEVQDYLIGQVMHRINLYVYNMQDRGQITEDNGQYLTTDIERTQLFCMLPMSTEELTSCPGRLIVSGGRAQLKGVPT